MTEPSPRECVFVRFLDAIHYKVKEDHQCQTKAAYVVLGITTTVIEDEALEHLISF